MQELEYRFDYGLTDDDLGYTHEQWRVKWIADGMRWSSAARHPPGWDPAAQLRSIEG